jgi:hypothetical protein
MHSDISISAKRVTAALPFVILAGLSVLAGGLLAAVVALHPSQHAVWTASYLVLVVGILQFALGLGQALLTVDTPAAGLLAGQWLLLNFGNAGVIIGTLIATPPLVGGGSILMLIALALFLYATRTVRHRMFAYLYRVLLIFILISIAAGAILSVFQN